MADGGLREIVMCILGAAWLGSGNNVSRGVEHICKSTSDGPGVLKLVDRRFDSQQKEGGALL